MQCLAAVSHWVKEVRIALAFAAIIASSILAPATPSQSAEDRAVAPVLTANIFGIDDRERHNRAPRTPYGAIVLIIDPTTDKAGTGFLIAPCYMMSALHVVMSGFDLAARRYPSVRYQYTL